MPRAQQDVGHRIYDVFKASYSWTNLVSRAPSLKVVPEPTTRSPGIYKLYRFFFGALQRSPHFCRYATFL